MEPTEMRDLAEELRERVKNSDSFEGLKANLIGMAYGLDDDADDLENELL